MTQRDSPDSVVIQTIGGGGCIRFGSIAVKRHGVTGRPSMMHNKDLDQIVEEVSSEPENTEPVFLARGEFLSELSENGSGTPRDISVVSGELILCDTLSSRAVAELLARCLGLTRPNRESLYLFGEDLGRVSRRRAAKLRRRIGVCGGVLGLDNELTVVGNISLPCQLKKLSGKQTAARVARVAEALALADLLPLQTSRLGFAERRIVAVARALAHDPELALLEDPLAGISGDRRERLASLIHRLAVTGAAVVVFNDQSSELSNPPAHLPEVGDTSERESKTNLESPED